jgi:serine/threonine-protein kinase HipA
MRQRKRHLDIRTLLDNLDGAHIGALKVVSTDPLSPKKIEPERIKSIKLAEAKGIADAIWKGDLEAISNNADSLKLLLSSGSGVGGARPKLLVNHNNHEWIAKFNRSQDAFDNAGAEWASMELARLAGLEVPDVELHQIGERKCLIVRRFDVDKENARSHLLTINACLKDEHSLEDPYSGSYEDIADIIRKFSHQPKKDLSQLLGQALINSAINNTDDHLRNFSIIHTEKGWQLSPAYDLVPSDSVGSYHQITINRNPFWNGPERPDDVIKALKINKSEGIAVAEKVLQALESWPELLKAGGVDDFWIKKLSGRLISTSESTLDR